MLHINHQGVLAARTVDEFRAEIVRFANNMGFGTVDTLTVVDHPGAQTEFICIDNVDRKGWNEATGALGHLDPVMQHCRVSSLPIVWNSSNYREPCHQGIYELVSSFGLSSGISTAAHLQGGRHFALCLHSDQDQSPSARQLAQLMPALQMFATHALDAAFRLLLPAGEQVDPERLTIMETDALCRVMDGKTREQISDLLNISEANVQRHLRSAASKLRCANEYQAVLKALRLEIIY